MPWFRRDASVAVVIPALDEAGSIGAVLDDLPDGIRAIVVDNGSTDATAGIARERGADVITATRRGYGTAVRAGFAHLAADPPEVVVVLDGDHADDPALIGRLVDPIADDRADLAIADRSRTAAPGALTPVQRLGNALAVRAIALACGRRFRDLGPFRAIRWSAVERLGLVDPTWGFNVEMNLKAAKLGLRVEEVALVYRARRTGRSKISGTIVGSARAGYRIVRAVQRYR